MVRWVYFTLFAALSSTIWLWWARGTRGERSMPLVRRVGSPWLGVARWYAFIWFDFDGLCDWLLLGDLDDALESTGGVISFLWWKWRELKVHFYEILKNKLTLYIAINQITDIVVQLWPKSYNPPWLKEVNYFNTELVRKMFYRRG